MRGKLTSVVGPMFSGKSYELIRIINVAIISGHKVQIFKPEDRFENSIINSRNGVSIKAEKLSVNISTSGILYEFTKNNPSLIAIDEVQFYNQDIVDAINIGLEKSINFVVSGLPTDFKGRPFGPVPNLMAMSDEIIHIKGICNVCKEENGTKTYRTTNSDELVVVDSDVYECRCYKHFKIN